MTVFVPTPTNSPVSATLSAAHVASSSSEGSPVPTPSNSDLPDPGGVRLQGHPVEPVESTADSDGGAASTPTSTESGVLIRSGASTPVMVEHSDLDASNVPSVANGAGPFEGDESGNAIISGACDIAAKASNLGSSVTQPKQQLPDPKTPPSTHVAGTGLPKPAVDPSSAASSSSPKHGSPLPASLKNLFERAREANLDIFNLLHRYAARSSQHDDEGLLKSMEVQLAAGGMADVTVTKKTYKDQHDQAKTVPYITGGQYKLLARALVRDRNAPRLSVWSLVRSLETAVEAREKVHAWFCALPATDERVKDNAGHAAFIATLREVKETILGHYNYMTRHNYDNEDSDDDDD